MSIEEEDELCRFGTPLDPIEEDEVPTKKKITLADQIAVDSNGKRRFHGAFTGGFSAGYWNTVGSSEGWTPSEFKSSRGEKAERRVQRPSDFMDDEDVGEFGIAPQRIQTTEDFGPSEKKNKRKLHNTQGPIPGVPVLELVLESCRDKAAVRLLKRMDIKYASKFLDKSKSPEKEFEKLTEEKTLEDHKLMEDITGEDDDAKVYKCDMGPIRRSQDHSDDDSDSDDDGHLAFDEDEFDAIFNDMRINRFGLGYAGLDKGNFFATVGVEVPMAHSSFSSLTTFSMTDQHNKSVSIKGQAFGVGAFEEDDDDIYVRDDINKYDFQLGAKTEESKVKAIENSSKNFIEGFNQIPRNVSSIGQKNIFSVRLPHSFEPRNWLVRKSRFGPTLPIASTSTADSSTAKVVGRHDLNPSQRGTILGDKPKTAADSIEERLKAAGLKEMNFVAGPTVNKSLEDSNEDEYKPAVVHLDEENTTTNNKNFIVPESIPQIADRFTSSDDSKTEMPTSSERKDEKHPMIDAPKEIKRVVRTKQAWEPCQLLCYKMNMEAAVGTKPDKTKTFSLFECITTNNQTARKNRLEFTSAPQIEDERAELIKLAEQSQEKQNQIRASSQYSTRAVQPVIAKPPASNAPVVAEVKVIQAVRKVMKPKTELEMKILDTQDEHPSRKKDIFKAIFDSSSESEDSDNENSKPAEETNTSKPTTSDADILASLTKPTPILSSVYSQLPDEAFMPKLARELNILRNTSPPRGIFRNLAKKSDQVAATSSVNPVQLDPDTYGPTLPPSRPSNDRSLLNKLLVGASDASIPLTSSSVDKGSEEKWIEKSDEKERKHKKEKKHKKDRSRNRDESRSRSRSRDRHKKKKSGKEKHKKKKH